MRSQYDTLLPSETPVEKSSSGKPLCLSLSAAAVCALFVTAWVVNPNAMDKGATHALNLVEGEDMSDIPAARMVMYLRANDVLNALTDNIPTHLILTDVASVAEEDEVAIKERLSALQAEGMAVLLEENADQVEKLRNDFPLYHAALTSAIVSWKADGLDIDGTKCPADSIYMCSTADLMRLVASIRADMPQDFIITVSPGAHQVFGSDHTSRQVLRDLVLKQEVNDEIDWLNVHFDAGWTEDLAEKIVKSMQESEYAAETIVPIISYSEDDQGYLSLDEMKEKFASNFGGFGADYTKKEF